MKKWEWKKYFDERKSIRINAGDGKVKEVGSRVVEEGSESGEM